MSKDIHTNSTHSFKLIINLVILKSVIGTFGNKVPENFECSKNEIFGLRQLLDKNFEIKTLSAKKDCDLLSFNHENFNNMMESTDKNIAIFLKSLIQHGTY